MPEDINKSRKNRRTLIHAAIGNAVLLAFVALGFYLTSSGFQDRVRRKVVFELEQVTGGRVELASFNWNLSNLEFVCENLTIHGLEPADEMPYAHADFLKVRLKILSVFRRTIDLRFVGVQRPVIHIIVNADGSTNQPVPKVVQSGGNPAGVLFELAIAHLEASDGIVVWNDVRMPLNFQADKVSTLMSYARPENRYDGRISIGGSVATMGDFKPIASNGEMQFALTHSGVQIKSLKWASPASNFEASGRIINFQQPEIELAYRGTLDAAELGAMVRMPSLRSGKIALQGNGSWAIAHFASTGRLTVKNLAYRDTLLDVSNLDASTAFSLTQNQLVFSHLVGQVFGGTVQGNGTVKNWMKLDTHATEKAVQRGNASFRLNALDAAKLVTAISSTSLPLSKLHLAGNATGHVDLSWKGLPALAEANMVLDVAPSAHPMRGSLPLAAHLAGSYQIARNQATISALTFTTPASQATASGILGNDSTQLTLQFETRNLYEWGPMISAVSSGRLPVDLKGSAAFKGFLYGKLAAPSIRGVLDVINFDSLLNLALDGGTSAAKSLTVRRSSLPVRPLPFFTASDGTPAHRIHWDSLHVDIDYTGNSVSFQNGLLRRGAAEMSFSGRSTLQKGNLTDASQFAVQTSVRDARFEDLQSIAGMAYPVTGSLTFNANLFGTPNDIRGEGHLQLASGTAYGEPFKSVRADINFVDGEAQAKNVAISQNGAQLTGSGALNLTTKAFRFDARGANFDFAHLQTLQLKKFTLGGIATFDATGSGTLEQPVINAHLQVVRLVMNGEQVGDITADAVTVGNELKLNARSKLVNADLHADGTVQLTGDFPAKMAVRFNKLDFDPLFRAYLGANPVSGHSSANGSIDLSGPLRYPRLLQISGIVSQVSAEIQNIALVNQGPIIFAMANQVAELKQFHITGEGTDLEAKGTAQLIGQRQLQGQVDGNANLKLFQGFAPDLISYGSTSLKMTVSGTLNKPTVTGQVNINQAGISYADMPNGLTDINGTLTFNENRLHISSLTARTGGGTVELGGFISYRQGLFFDITAKGKDIRLRYPPGVSAAASADLRYAGTTQNALLSGDVTVTRFGLNPRFDFALYLARSKQTPTSAKVNPLLDALRYDVHIVSTPELRVETSLAKITGDVDLRLRGTAARPSLLGKVNITDGDVFFSSTKYHLERGDIVFTNPLRIEPVLNLEASARVREYDVTIGLHGSADNLSTSYRSDPPLSSSDIIALLALGRTRDDTAISNQQPTQSTTDTASNAVLGEALNAAVSSRVQRLFGVSRIKIDPQVGGPENNPNARLTVEQPVNKYITLTYITNLSQSTQQIIQAEFTINRSLSVVIVRDQNGVLGMEIRLRQRKR